MAESVTHLLAASLAADLARRHESNGWNARDLFAAYVALVFNRDSSVAADCLNALDETVSARVNKGE